MTIKPDQLMQLLSESKRDAYNAAKALDMAMTALLQRDEEIEKLRATMEKTKQFLSSIEE